MVWGLVARVLQPGAGGQVVSFAGGDGDGEEVTM